jgi:periplasmic divalent cation tolerance protein
LERRNQLWQTAQIAAVAGVCEEKAKIEYRKIKGDAVLGFYAVNWEGDRVLFDMTDKRLVLTTAESQNQARRIADVLIERKLAACVNIVPGVQSIYRWKGKAEEAEEWFLWIKTTAGASERVYEAIKELHSYEMPECLCLAVEGGSSEYLRWIEESVE